MANILFIDDYQAADTIMRVLVTELGHDYSSAHDAVEAMALVAGHRYDIIFVDINLPDMRGERLAASIRHTPLNMHAYLIGYSVDKDAIDSSRIALFDAVEEKILDFDHVSHVIAMAERANVAAC